MYEIIIYKPAEKKLSNMPSRDKKRIAEKLYFLALDPDDKRLDVKKLINNGNFRLRVGSWRVIFNRDDCLKIISVERIGSRGDVYK